MALITIEQANHHLRLDLSQSGSPLEFDDPRLPNVEMKIAQAEAIILNYLKVAVDVDPNDSPPLWGERDRQNVEAAVLLALSALFDDDKDRTLADYMAPMGVITLLLMRLRSPALA